jgi:pimeloyl-ACP methyl ester carboxylesterase
MEAEHSHLQTVTVPQVGHAPTLDEPVAADAIEAFLAGLEAQGL